MYLVGTGSWFYPFMDPQTCQDALVVVTLQGLHIIDSLGPTIQTIKINLGITGSGPWASEHFLGTVL